MNGRPRRSGGQSARRGAAPGGLRPSGAGQRRPKTGQFICSKTGHFYLLPTPKRLLGDRRFANFSHKAPTRRGKSYILARLTR